MHNNKVILSVKEGDTQPEVTYELENVDSLENADGVRFYMQHQTTGDLIVNDIATIDDKTTATVSYELTEKQTARIGRHLAEFVVHYGDGTKQTSPNNGFIAIDVHESTNRDADSVDLADGDISATIIRADEIQGNTSDKVQVNADVGIRDLTVSDSGTEATFDYGGTQMVVDSDGIRVPDAPGRSTDVARQADIANQVESPMQATVDANGFGIRNLADPGSSDEAANKGYVDSQVGGATGSWDTESWEILDASNYGYPGDGTGGDIVDLFRTARDNYESVVVVLPEGTYSYESQFDLYGTDTASNMKIVGKQHATLDVTTNTVDRMFNLGDYYGDDNADMFALENVSYDVTGSLDAGLGRFNVHHRLVIDNVTQVGQRQRASYGGDRYNLLAQLTSERGVGHIRNIDFSAGSEYDGYEGANVIGASSDPGHVGTIYWEGCQIEEFYDNGLYINGSPGTNIVLGGIYRNNGRANVRIGEGDSGRDFISVFDATSTELPSNWDARSCPDLLDCDDSNGNTFVHGAKLWNITNDNQAITVRSNAETVALHDLEVVNRTGNAIMKCTSSPDSDAGQYAKHRPHFGSGVAKVRVIGGSYYDNPDDKTENKAFISTTDLSLENITYYCDSGSAEDYRAFCSAESGGSVQARDCVIENNAASGGMLRGGGNGVIQATGCKIKAEYAAFSGIAAYFTLMDNDCRNVTNMWYGGDDPTVWATEARVGGNFGHMTEEYTIGN